MEGNATVVVSFDTWPEGKVSPTTHEITVLAPKKGPKREPVSERLVKTLPHPDRKVTVGDVRFSPDGKRLLTSGYPSGIVQVWDTTSWKEIVRINTPSGSRSSLIYAIPTPDWKTLLVHVRSRKLVREEKAGKVHERLQIDGRVDCYDLDTGKLRDSIPFADRGPAQLFLSPDGKYALVNTEGSFTAENSRKRPAFCELLDLSTKATRKLFDWQAYPAFTPDGKTAYLSKYEFLATGKVNAALIKYDVAAGKELRAVAAPDDQTFFDSATLSPDGKWVVTAHRTLKPPSTTLLVLAADTLEEAARLPGPKDADRNTYFEMPQFSADGRTMVTRCNGPLLVWDVAAKKVVRTVAVADLQFGGMKLCPDGKRVVVAGMPQFDVSRLNRGTDPMDLPQPRLCLIDLADPKGEGEVVVLPNGTTRALAFHPDGKTLAVGSYGGVHLIDLTRRR